MSTKFLGHGPEQNTLLSWIFSYFSSFYFGLLFLYRQLFVEPPYPIIYWTGKTVIVTGSSGGIGLEAETHFVRLGAQRVIITARDDEKGKQARRIIESITGRHDVVECWGLELSSSDSVKNFVNRANCLDRLDAVVCNAAVATPTFRLVDRDETTITVNVINTFLLAFMLLPSLRKTSRNHGTVAHLSFVCSEVIFHTSLTELEAPNILGALREKRAAYMLRRYHISKVMAAMIVREYFARHQDHHEVVVNYVNPGLCHSNLLRELPTPTYIIKTILARTAEVGSRTLVHAACAGRESHGQYLSDSEIRAPPYILCSKRGVELQRRLWDELMDHWTEIQPEIRQYV